LEKVAIFDAKPYQYKPFFSPNSIRLVRILNQDTSAGPCISLTAVDLSTNPSYNALSYTWSSPSAEATQRGVTGEQKHPVKCDGREILVTKNLFDFLVRAQTTFHFLLKEHIWIDALCINQEDVDERNTQVAMMGTIYESAMQVVVWLGEEEESTHLAVEMMSVMGKASLPSMEEMQVVHIKDDPAMVQLLGPLGNLSQHWDALIIFMERNWFTRIWIIQEVALAASLEIICGRELLALDHLKAAAGFLLHLKLWLVAGRGYVLV
jgi:hypothetical protein